MAQIRFTTKPKAISTSLVGLVFRVIIAWVELEISQSKKVMLGSEKNTPNHSTSHLHTPNQGQRKTTPKTPLQDALKRPHPTL